MSNKTSTKPLTTKTASSRHALAQQLERTVGAFLGAGCTCRGTHDDARPRCQMNITYGAMQAAYSELRLWDDARAAVAAVLGAPPIPSGEVR